MRPLILIAILVAAVPGARAGETAWAELAPDTRVRLISADGREADGTVLAAIELDMPQGTKTYWRVPGETGIPLTLDLSGSTGIAGHTLFWPFPEIEVKEGYTDFVHYGPTIIPLALTVQGDAPVLQAGLVMGICSDICVPAMADLTLPIDPAKPDPGQSLRIAQAMAEVPIPWDGDPGAIGEVAVDAPAGSLWLGLDPAVVDPSSVVLDASAAGYLVGAPQKSRESGVVELPLIGGGDGADLLAKSIEIVFMTRNGPYWVSRRVGRSTSP